MNNSNFLDTDNFKYLINFVFNDIHQKTNHDISNNKKYIGIFKKLVQTVHNKNMNKRVSKEYLNNLVIDKCVPFIIKQLNKEQIQNNSNTNYNNQPINISSRPLASHKPKLNTNTNNDFSSLTLHDDISDQPNHNFVDNLSGIASRNGEKIDFSSRMKDFQDSRSGDDPRQNQNQLKSVNEIIGAQSNDEEKIDFAKKMQELQNERNYTSQNDSMVNFEKQNNSQNIKNHDALQNTNNQHVEIDNSFMEQLYENNKNADIDPKLLNKMSQNYLNNSNDDDEDNLINSYQNLELNIKDRSEHNQLPTYDTNIDNLKIDYTSEKMSKNVENAEKELYQTTKKYNRNPAQLIVVSNTELIGAASDITFQANLIEPIIIDKPADVFLEFLNLQNINGNGVANIETVNCFALKIDEFNTSTASNINELKDKYIIPNDSFGTTDNVADAADAADVTNRVDATSYNIKLKSNYMCTINPMEISSLNISLYGLIDGALGFLEGIGGGGGETGKVIIGLFIKKH
jgi:hypothetical protein